MMDEFYPFFFFSLLLVFNMLGDICFNKDKLGLTNKESSWWMEYRDEGFKYWIWFLKEAGRELMMITFKLTISLCRIVSTKPTISVKWKHTFFSTCLFLNLEHGSCNDITIIVRVICIVSIGETSWNSNKQVWVDQWFCDNRWKWSR
jgi:hypothetical protein